MSEELTTRFATDDDVPAILGLVSKSLGEGTIPRNTEYWRWKHSANPFGPSPCLLSEAEGQIVGLRAFMRWQWQSGERSVPAVRAVDTATHPKWRGKRIFNRLTMALVEQMTAEGVGFVFNTPNAQSRPGYLKMGWTSLGKTRLWVRPIRPLRIARALARRSKLAPTEQTDDRRERFPSVRDLLAQPAVDGLFASTTREDTRLATSLSRRYLDWRYVAVPGFSYYATWALDGTSSAAVIFRFKSQGSLRELRVCDLLVGPGRGSRAAASRLLRALVRDADVDYGAAMAAPGTQEQASLIRALFFPAPRTGPIFTVRPLAAGVSPVDPTSIANWRLSIGALELF